jgi:hypothetical protein
MNKKWNGMESNRSSKAMMMMMMMMIAKAHHHHIENLKFGKFCSFFPSLKTRKN